jgi:hypothetical protein
VAIDALHRLEYTVLGVDLKIADLPQNYLTITYQLKKNNENSTQLHVSMGDSSAVGSGKARYDKTIASGGWTPRLGKVKQLAENL